MESHTWTPHTWSHCLLHAIDSMKYYKMTALWMLRETSVQLLSCVWLFVTPWIAAHLASLSITNSQSLIKLMSIESVMPSSHLILCRPLFLLPPIPPSFKVFSKRVNSLHEVAKVLEFQLQHQSFQWTPGLISFRIGWRNLRNINWKNKGTGRLSWAL